MKICVWFFISTIWISSSLAIEIADIIVAKDGNGDFTTVQDAINSIPSNNSSLKIILIKNGIYNEEIRIDTDFIALIGEDRDSTRIEYYKPYDWDSNYVDVGRAVINIYASDITLANLTVANTQPEVGIHAFTIYGDGNCNRVITINCNIISNGGDTMALWNGETGMYYHNTLYLQGAVDFLCPRGWCYADNIEFYCTRTTTPLWHDGSKDIDQKLIVKNSTFDGATSFDLGRNHLDGAFYLVNLRFSEKMRDSDFELPESADGPYKWGRRYYYDDCYRPAGNYDWHKDNMITATGSPMPEEITAKWTFSTSNNPWDPEATMPSVLPMSFLPKPDNNQIRVELNPTLSWIPGRNAQSHNVYFGTENPPPLAYNTTEWTYNPGTLEPNTIYYWKVDEVDGDEIVEGNIWEFRTRVDNLPPKVIQPFPADDAIDVDVPIERLLWEGDSIQIDLYHTYWGVDQDSLNLISSYSVEGYYLPPLVIGETYYWRVDAENQVGTTQGDLWQFSMKKSFYNIPDYYQSDDDQGIISFEVEDYTDSTIISEHVWTFVTEPSDYSGSGAMQLLPDNGTVYNTTYFERCSRLDYAVDFIKTGTHYIWIRAYAPSTSSNTFHMGINFIEEKNASRIGDFKGTEQWEWINAHPNDSTWIRSFEVEAIGTQGVSLWFAEDGVIADKIVLTTDPNYVPTGYGPDVTVGLENTSNNRLPQKLQLNQNFPNPFNPKTTIIYTLPEATNVELSIFDILGRKVSTLINEYMQAGRHQITWNAKKLAGGIYFAQIKTSSITKSIRLLYLP
jgi:pectinesterase